MTAVDTRQSFIFIDNFMFRLLVFMPTFKLICYLISLNPVVPYFSIGPGRLSTKVEKVFCLDCNVSTVKLMELHALSLSGDRFNPKFLQINPKLLQGAHT